MSMLLQQALKQAMFLMTAELERALPSQLPGLNRTLVGNVVADLVGVHSMRSYGLVRGG